MTKVYVVLEFELERPIPDLADKVANRASTMQYVKSCEVADTGFIGLSVRDMAPSTPLQQVVGS